MVDLSLPDAILASTENASAEQKRLSVLRSYAILDTPAEARFDDIAALAADICDTPIAAVSLVDEHRQWFKATYGLSVRETPIEVSFCKHAIAGLDLFVVEDATRDPRFASNALVTGDPSIRFYAGCPLVTEEGISLGTLMVIDRVPRQLSASQRTQLTRLAHQVVVALELHRQRAQLRLQLAALAHDHARLHALSAEVTGAGYWSHDGTTDGVKLAPEACALLDWRGEPLVRVEELLRQLPDHEQSAWHAAFNQCETAGVPMDVQCTWRTSAGHSLLTRWQAVRTRELGAERDRVLGVVVDITTASQLARQNQQVQERFQLVAELVSDALWEWDIVHQTMWWNGGMSTLFGYPQPEQVVPADAWKFLHAEDQPKVERSVREALASATTQWQSTYRVMRADGDIAWVENRATIVRDREGTALRMVGAMTDISEAVRLRAQREADIDRLQQQATLLDQARDAIIVKDTAHRIEFWNAGAQRLYGWSASEAIGRHAPTLLQEDPYMVEELDQQLARHGESRSDVVHFNRSGQRLDIHAHWTLVRDGAGRPRAAFGIFTDITQSRRDQERIYHLAFYDQLTRLPNRTLLTDRLHHALAASRRHRQCGALIFLDLDNFKGLNDTQGHAVGDQLLQQVASRLQHSVRSMDTVARLGGDEFVIILEELGNDAGKAVAQAQVAAYKILASFQAPFMLGHFEYRGGSSIGVTLFNGDGEGLDELLRQADIAMYEAKQAGRNRVRFFDPQMQHMVTERAQLENDLRRASLQDEFVLYYQPLWHRDGRMAGAEALLRWQHPTRGLLEPGEFIMIAEETGVIVPLGRWVLQTACQQLAQWQAQGQRLRISVNVSARQLRSKSFVADVRGALSAAGAEPTGLSLELTESMLVKDVETTVAKMNELKALGVRFSLDDFGTGYSSLSLLERLPLDELKIDRSFVHRVEAAPRDRQVIQSIVRLGKNLDLQVIAEGIETEGQQQWLAEFGCDEFQGFLRGASMPVDEVARLL